MDELTLDNKKYLSSKKAAQVTGYAKDYVGQLCREGRVDARLVGRNWYVLETSILEHRFGAEEPEKTSAPTEKELESTWQTPRYSAEPVQMVPELASRRPVPPAEPLEAHQEPEEAPVAPQLADMQSAWKEWFATQQVQEQALPDASEMLLADHEEEPVRYTEAAPEAPEAPEEPQAAYEEQEVSVPVHIERHSYAEQPRYGRITRIEEMPISRRYEEIEREEGPEVEPAPVVRRRQRVRPARKSVNTLVLRSVFIAVAGVAIAATVIGSGVLDRFTGEGTGSFVTDFLSGTNQVSK